MLSRRYSLRLALLSLIVIAIALRNGTEIGSAQIRQPPPVDLSGKWTLDSGETVTIEHLTLSGAVYARFSPSLKCHDDVRSALFSTFLDVTPVTGGPPKLSLKDGTFFACTRSKKLIDSCSGVKAVFKSKFRNATVSEDGDSITGERFHEWIAYDLDDDGNYKNCHNEHSKDYWEEFTLTRACAPDKAKRCNALAKAMKTISKILDTGLHSPTAAEWKQSVARHKDALKAELDKLQKQFCNDKAALAKIDKAKAALELVSGGSAQTPSQIVGERTIMAGVDLDLKTIATKSCTAGGPPPKPSGLCSGGTPAKEPGDNETIDAARKQIDDAIKEALKMLQEYERDAQGGANTTAGQYADYWRTRLGQLRKLKGYWDMIRNASCIPPDLMDLIRAVMGGRTDMCTDLCFETAKWIETWYPGPNGDIQKKAFIELCGFNCP